MLCVWEKAKVIVEGMGKEATLNICKMHKNTVLTAIFQVNLG